METSPQFMLIFAVVISSLIAFRSYKRKSLNLSGGVAGFLVMTIHFAAGFRFLLPLLPSLHYDEIPFFLFTDELDRINLLNLKGTELCCSCSFLLRRSLPRLEKIRNDALMLSSRKVAKGTGNIFLHLQYCEFLLCFEDHRYSILVYENDFSALNFVSLCGY